MACSWLRAELKYKQVWDHVTCEFVKKQQANRKRKDNGHSRIYGTVSIMNGLSIMQRMLLLSDSYDVVISQIYKAKRHIYNCFDIFTSMSQGTIFVR